MSCIKNFLLETAYEYQKYHPIYTLDECQEIVRETHDFEYWANYGEMMLNQHIASLELVFSFDTSEELLLFLDSFRKSVDRSKGLRDSFNNGYIFLKQLNDKRIILYIDPKNCGAHCIRIRRGENDILEFLRECGFFER